MKLVVRADDYGFTKNNNDGVLKTVEEGIVTSVDIMLDTPGMEDALERIKHYGWVSMGWHTHFWWKPLLDPKEVPSLVVPETGRFKTNVAAHEDVTYEDAYKECRAEIIKCIQICGRAPDVTDMPGEAGLKLPFNAARRDVCDEFGIEYHFSIRHGKNPHIVTDRNKPIEATPVVMPDEKYKDLDMLWPNDLASLLWVHQDSAADFMLNYNPVDYYKNDPDGLMKHKIGVQPWHPGYVDEFMVKVYDNPLLNMARLVDMNALCSDEIKAWVRDNKVELVNFRDALHGTKQYQNHLRAIGSDMAV